MSCRCGREQDIRDVLCRNVGRLCTVFTTNGGNAGCGFTGVLSAVDDETCSLVSSAPFNNPMSDRRCRSVFGSTQTIPIDRITCVSTPQF